MAGGRGAVSLEPVSDLEEEPDPVTGDIQLIDDRVYLYHIILIYFTAVVTSCIVFSFIASLLCVILFFIAWLVFIVLFRKSSSFSWL